MSKTVECNISCIYCDNEKEITVYKTIWGENNKNRSMVFNDKINLFDCDSCGKTFRMPFSLLYSNTQSDLVFAVWYDPSDDYTGEIKGFKEMSIKQHGDDDYFVTAPQIEDWDEFKNTIIKFESGELKASRGSGGNKSGGFLKNLFK